MSTQIILPRILQVGDGASKEAGNILKSLDCKRPLIVTDPMMVKLGYVARLQESLDAVSIQSDIFQETVPEPTVT
ncbi:MAG: alcohol dehydrogenase class IV, partial [Flavobacteriales bacterium]